jgi:hypothetical protein
VVLAPQVVITHFEGHITRQLAESQLMYFMAALARTQKPQWIMNLTEMTGFDPNAVTAGSEWFRQLKMRDGEHILLVSTQAAARMAAATISFGVGLKIHTFQNLEQALDQCGLESPTRFAARR